MYQGYNSYSFMLWKKPDCPGCNGKRSHGLRARQCIQSFLLSVISLKEFLSHLQELWLLTFLVCGALDERCLLTLLLSVNTHHCTLLRMPLTLRVMAKKHGSALEVTVVAGIAQHSMTAVLTSSRGFILFNFYNSTRELGLHYFPDEKTRLYEYFFFFF